MLEAILMLNQILQEVDDSLFYQHHDFSEQVRAALSASPEPFVVCLAGPRVHALDRHEALPLYVCWKENDVDNAELSTERYGHVVLSSAATGELRVVKLHEREKEPAGGGRQPELPPNHVPKKTTYYRCEYDPVPRERLPVHAGTWLGIVQSGSFASAPRAFELRTSTPPQEPDPARELLERDPGEVPEPPGLHVDAPPAPLAAAGFELEVPPPARIRPGKPLVIACRFALPDDGDEALRSVPVHLLVTGRQFERLEVESLLVPKSETAASDGLRRGAFTLDLAPLFLGPSSQGRTLTDDLYVTAVSRGVFGAPVRVQVAEEE